MSRHQPLTAESDAAQPPLDESRASSSPEYALVSGAAARSVGISPSGAWRLGGRTGAPAASLALAAAPRPSVGS